MFKWMYRNKGTITLITAGLCTVGAVVGYFTSPLIDKSRTITVMIPTQIDSDKVPEKTLEGLIVNNFNNSRIIVQKSEQEGISDLQALANEADFEESWAYIAGENKWVEIGLTAMGFDIDLNSDDSIVYAAETPSSQSVIIDMEQVSRLIDRYDNITLYHIHPLNQDTFDELARDVDPAELSVFRDYVNVVYAIPSPEDNTNMSQIASEFYQQHPNGKIVFKICSPLGVTQAEFTEQGIEIFVDKTSEEIGEYHENLDSVTVSLKGSYDPIDKINEIIALFNGGKYEMSFTPYAE